MKTFNEICMMTQKEVKEYMREYLTSKAYKVANEDGYLYAKGDVPVLLMAHMDTVHKENCRDIINENGKIYSPQGIGGDDRCGIFMIMNIVKELHCSVLLCEDEEIGMVGARKFTQSDYVNDVDVNYIIEFDRKGVNDAVFYSCDNKEFTDFVCDNTGFKESYGSFSDISTVAPALKTAAVNLSCGYYNAHTTQEYVMYDEMMDIIEAAKALIKTESEHFEYVAKKYPSPSIKNNYSYGHQYDLFEDSQFAKRVKKDLKTEIEVVWYDVDGEEQVGYGEGNTKAEAWLDFFMTNEEVSFSMVVDYSFC